VAPLEISRLEVRKSKKDGLDICINRVDWFYLAQYANQILNIKDFVSYAEL